MADMSAFFNDNTKSEMAAASDKETSNSSKIVYPGIYRCAIPSSKFEGKDGDIYTFPNTSISENAGSLLLNFIFETVDSTDKVQEGSYAYGMIVLAPSPNATPKKIKNTMKMAKPRLKAVLGEEVMADFSYDEDWVTTNLLSDFKKKGDSYECTREHNMKQEVMVTLEAEDYNGKTKLAVTSIVSAKDGDVSRTTGPSIEEPEVVSEDDAKDAAFMDEVTTPEMF